jgi:hypothetical protein
MNKYKLLTNDELEEHFSNYLIYSWSYSKVSTFARNEKAFEMQYIYNMPHRLSSTTVSGQAYHAALEYFFSSFKDEGVKHDIVTLEHEAFEYIDSIDAAKWKIQKTTPTVQSCIDKAQKTVVSLLNNFYSEINVYLDEIDEIIGAEEYIKEFVVINGVEIPLPCHLKIDLTVKTKDGKVVIIDHKSRSKFTNESEIGLVDSKQAITYAIGYETRYNVKVDEVWFIENKYSKNRDGSKQLGKYTVVLDKSSRILYESMLYEAVKRMIEAISNPDYIYLINDQDNLIDKAELFDFWTNTMLAEADDLILLENQDLIRERHRKIRDVSLASASPNVLKNFKKYTEQFIPYDLTNKNMANSEKIEHVLRTLGISAKVAHELEGYSSKTYLLEVSAGTAITKVMRYNLDIANALNQPNVRIQKNLFVYEGKSYVGIETAHNSDDILRWDTKELNGFNLPIGVDNLGNTIAWDLNSPATPHVLVCGQTGSGKSVCLISTLMYAIEAGIKDIVILDPKNEFKKLPLPSFVKVVSDISDIELEAMMLVEEMNDRYENGEYSKKLIIFDEFADAFMLSRSGNALKNYSMETVGMYKNGLPKMKNVHTSTDKSLQENIQMLAQKGRAAGFNIVAATQRASVKIVSGDIKVNFPVQICFSVDKEVSSKVVIDEPGAETLTGNGDGLIKAPGLNVTRFQGYFYKI